jgi:hypothetical protein
MESVVAGPALTWDEMLSRKQEDLTLSHFTEVVHVTKSNYQSRFLYPNIKLEQQTTAFALPVHGLLIHQSV